MDEAFTGDSPGTDELEDERDWVVVDDDTQDDPPAEAGSDGAEGNAA
jgi:hypothetical protein